jgi:transglutaminase-like putative cysteine protease
MKWRLYRPPDPLPDRGAANVLFLCAAATIILHASRQPLVINLGAASLLAWSWLIVHRGWHAPGAWLRAILVVVAVFSVARDYGTVLGRDAGVSFLMLLLALKLTELKRARDYRIAVFLVYFATLSAFLFSQGPETAAFALALGLATTWTLHRINHPGAFLEAKGLRTALGAMLYALPLMILLYLFFPRLAGGLIAIPTLETAGRIGLSDRVAPGSVQQLLASDAPALRAFFETAPPPTAELYWRALVLNISDGRIWSAGLRNTGTTVGASAENAPLRYQVQLEPSAQRALPALGWPAVAPAGTALEKGGVLRAESVLRDARRFELASFLRYRDMDEGEMPRAPRLNPRVRALVQTFTENGTQDARVLADAVLRHFREQPFRYTLSPPPLPDDWLAAFLFETRAGYCEHYASAFATIMRAAGVPSRVVTGYQGGEWNATGNYLLVRQSDAHAWAEVFFPGEGWTRVDPTAAIAPERVEHGIEALRALEARGSTIGTLAPEAVRRFIVRPWWRSLWRGAQQRYDAFLVKWNHWASDYDSERQLHLLKKLGFEDPNWHQLVGILVAGTGMLLLLVAANLFRRRSRPDPVLRSWDRFCKRLARMGVARAPHEGPLDYTLRAGEQFPRARAEISEIGDLYARLRYGRRSADLIRELARRVRLLRVTRENRPANA